MKRAFQCTLESKDFLSIYFNLSGYFTFLLYSCVMSFFFYSFLFLYFFPSFFLAYIHSFTLSNRDQATFLFEAGLRSRMEFIRHRLQSHSGSSFPAPRLCIPGKLHSKIKISRNLGILPMEQPLRHVEK